MYVNISLVKLLISIKYSHSCRSFSVRRGGRRRVGIILAGQTHVTARWLRHINIIVLCSVNAHTIYYFIDCLTVERVRSDSSGNDIRCAIFADR